MSIWQTAVLGVVQGLTEFLPVSSSGHLIFVPILFGWKYQGLAFDVVVHLGTLTAVIFFYRKKLWIMLRSLFFLDRGIHVDLSIGGEMGEHPKRYRRVAFLLLLSILPAGIVGFFFSDWIEQSTRSPWIVAGSLIVWGIILGIAELYQRAHVNRQHTLSSLTWRDALFIGIMQTISLIPGTSRSGITMSAGLFARLNKASAAEFSFLMSIPIIFLAGMASIKDLLGEGTLDSGIVSLVVGFLASAFSGFFALRFCLSIISRWSFMPFVWYRVMIGILLIVLIVL